MSCYWSIRCVDCNEDGAIRANHKDELARILVKNAASLASVGKLREVCGSVELDIDCIFVDLAFFVKHAGHNMRPVDEYGMFDTPCQVVMRCPKCEQDVKCEMREHDNTFRHGHCVGNAWHDIGEH